MAVKSGKTGSATWGGVAIDDVRNINVDTISEPQKYASSSTNCQRLEVPGHQDTGITFSIYDDEPPFDRGDIDTLELFARTGVLLFSGTVHISRVAFRVDIEAGSLNAADVTAGPATAP